MVAKVLRDSSPDASRQFPVNLFHDTARGVRVRQTASKVGETKPKRPVVQTFMEFHIPGAADHRTADLLWNQVKRRVEDTLGAGIMPRRLRAVALNLGEDVRWVEVGQSYEFEEVLIIFDSQTPLICTASHGFYKGKPIVVQPETLVAVEDFQD